MITNRHTFFLFLFSILRDPADGCNI